MRVIILWVTLRETASERKVLGAEVRILVRSTHEFIGKGQGSPPASTLRPHPSEPWHSENPVHCIGLPDWQRCVHLFSCSRRLFPGPWIVLQPAPAMQREVLPLQDDTWQISHHLHRRRPTGPGLPTPFAGFHSVRYALLQTWSASINNLLILLLSYKWKFNPYLQ
jgi:hypothetical protein